MREFKIGDRVVPVDDKQWVPGLEELKPLPGPGTVTRVHTTDVQVEFDSGDSWYIDIRQLRLASELAPGNLVELKSGSMKMTVIRLAPATSSEPADHVWVMYTEYGNGFGFSSSGPRIIERSLPVAALKRVEAK